MKYKCSKCHRRAINHDRTLCAVHISAMVWDLSHAIREKEVALGRRAFSYHRFNKVAVARALARRK